MSRQDFFEEYLDEAQEVSSRTGIKPSVILAVWAHETGGGTSRIFRENNNIAGIKYVGQALASGERYGHAVYNTVEDGIRDFERVVNLDYMRDVRRAESPRAQIREWCETPYATDPRYGEKVLNNWWKAYNMGKYDNGESNESGEGMRVPGGTLFHTGGDEVRVKADKAALMPAVLLVAGVILLGMVE